MEAGVGAGGDGGGEVGVDVERLDAIVLPDGPITRGAATSWRAEAFGWALPLVANEILCRPTGGPRDAVKRRVNARPTRSGHFKF